MADRDESNTRRTRPWPYARKLWHAFINSRFAPAFVFRRDAYSTEGEDLILRRVFGRRRKGFYVDVGAYHPKRRSNTFLFYRMGWNGINIEAHPGRIALFQQTRPRDTNIEAAVNDVNSQLAYYQFEIAAMNTFSTERADELMKSGYKVIREKTLMTRTLSDILAEHIDNSRTIDFMNIDVEGLELNVLRSSDWSRFRPKFVLLETLDWSLDSSEKSAPVRFLEGQGYRLFARTVHTSIFKSADL